MSSPDYPLPARPKLKGHSLRDTHGRVCMVRVCGCADPVNMGTGYHIFDFSGRTAFPRKLGTAVPNIWAHGWLARPA